MADAGDAGTNVGPEAGSGDRDGAAGEPTAGSGGIDSTAGSGGAASTAGEGGTGMAGGPAADGGMMGNPDSGAVDESAELFDEDVLPRFDITLPETSMAMLDADPATYVPGELRYGDEVVSDIGVRIKGDASLRPLSQKAAFKLKFDEFVPMQSFHGLRRLTLNNVVQDRSFLTERLAYTVYRAAGMPAPRCNNALVFVNGEPYGLYANVETEDKTFLRRWFSDEDGNLYEEGGRDFVAGAQEFFELETNEQDNDRSDIITTIEIFQAASPSSLLSDMDPVLDMQHFLRFTAAEAAVDQWDMYAYSTFGPNNFRLYHDPTSNKFVFLPWGMDLAMKPYTVTNRPHIAIYELSRIADQPDGMVTAGLLFQRCLESTECRAQYSDAVREVVEVYENLDLEAMAERYYAQIQPEVVADPKKEFSVEDFEAAYQVLLANIRERPDMIRAELDP